jgi:prolyl 4-hydroxylase
MITLLLYLTDQEGPGDGGETAFPKGGSDGKGFKVRPVKGNAVLFYNLLEDGNGDDLSLHAAQPVFKGEKWLANFWVWDPHR